MSRSNAAVLTKLRRFTWAKFRRRLARLLYREAEERIYRISVDDAREFETVPEFRMDCQKDIERYVAQPGESRDAVLQDWRRRIARGEHVFTRVEDNSLATYGWLIERQRVCFLNDVGQNYEFPENTAVIYDFFTVPDYRNREFYGQLLMHSVRAAAGIAGTKWIYMAARADDTVPLWWVERLGTEYCGSLFYRRVLWSKTKWRKP
jgi:hypothetical protein